MLYGYCSLDRNTLVLLSCACTLLLSGVGATFAQMPSNVTVREGQSTALACALSNTGTILWTLDAVIISPSNPLFSIATNDTYSELRIVRADHTQPSGHYQCMANGVVSAPAWVLVQYLNDDINIESTLVTTYEGGSASFICKPPSGIPLPNVRWETAGSLLTQNQHVSLSVGNKTLQLNALNIADSGIYYCVAENGLGKSVNTSAELRVQNVGQYAVTIPFAQFCAKAGTPLSIDCLIAPQPKGEMVVRWLHNGYALTSGKNDYYLRGNFTLKINSMSVKHVGAYCCVVEGGGKVMASDCTQVLMNCADKLQITVTPPYFTPTWSLLLNFSYSNIKLKSDHASGLMVSWFKGGVPVPQDRLLSNGSLLLHHMNLQSELGYYTVHSVHISNIQFITSVALPATVTPSLQLVASSTVIQLQSSITLQCSFTSNAYHGFTYRWFLNSLSSQILNDSTHSIYTTTLNSTLFISNIGSHDAGTYFCTVSEANVTASVNISLASYLYLLPITLSQQPTTVCNGSTLSLECPFGGGRGRSNVSWSLNSEPLVNQVGGVRLDQDGRSLIVVSSQTQNGGVYACNVSDGFTTFYQTLPVAVIVPGSIESIHSSTTEAMEGSAVRFDCIVSGMSSPHVIWLQGWVPVHELNDSSLVQLPNGSLLINPVSSKDENTYYCAIQVCYTLDIKQFFFKVISGNTSTANPSDAIPVDKIVLSVGLVFSGLMLAITIIIFISVCCCYYGDRVRERRSNTVRQRAQLAGALRRQASMRVSGRRDNGGSSLLETTTFTNPGKAKGIPPATTLNTSPTQPSPALLAPPTPTPTPVSTSTAISIDGHDQQNNQLPNFPRTNLQLSKRMGEGEFGPVMLAYKISSSMERSEVAVKMLLPPSAGAPRFHLSVVLSDFASQMQLQHSNICGILGLCTDAEPYYIIYEYLDKGDLKRSLLESREASIMTQKDFCNIVAQVADGMAFLYSQKIIHGDLATRNCLLSSQMKVKIADLGIGHDLYRNDYFDNGNQLLPIRWMAPELLTSNSAVGPDFSWHSDVWSFGVFCWEVFTFATQPYDNLTDLQVLEQVPRGHTLTPLAKLCPPLFHSIMQACWSYNMDERPKFSTLSVAIRKVTFEN